MTHPHHLHATANAWSLQVALDRLAELAAQERARAISEQLPAATCLRSPTYGTRHSSGDHGDPTEATVTTPTRTFPEDHWRTLHDRATGRLRWLADQLPPAADRSVWEPLDQIRARLPWTLPGTAAVIARHLADDDRWIRQAVSLNDDLVLLPDVACPRCDVRQIHVRTSAPAGARVIVCQAGTDGTGCACTGEGCACGMPVRVEGVRHVWAASAPRT